MDFSATAQKLIDAAQHDMVRAVELFHELCPNLVAQIRTDSARMGPLSFWGRSTNFDEFAKQTIVAPEIIQLLARTADKKVSVKLPHAGLQHTYGYLLSLIETPYGMKRDRWIETTLEAAFGLNASTLGPAPNSGTLLSNATWLSGQIAFRGNDENLNRLQTYLSGKHSPDFHQINFNNLPQTRITEQIKLNGKASPKTWSLQTDIVPFPTDNKTGLLIYSVREEHSCTHSLITLFPVGQETQQALLARTETPNRNDIRLRFNAYVPGLVGGEFDGTCRLTKL